MPKQSTLITIAAILATLIIATALTLILTIANTPNTITGTAILHNGTETPTQTELSVNDEPKTTEPTTTTPTGEVVTTNTPTTTSPTHTTQHTSNNQEVIITYQDADTYLTETFGENTSTIDPTLPVDVGGVTIPAGDIKSTLAELLQDLNQ